MGTTNLDALSLSGALAVAGAASVTGALSAAGITNTGFTDGTAATTITAGTTQTQAGATLLTAAINHVTTAVSGDGVRLPASVAGRVVYVINGTANSIQVYGLGTDTINDVATATGVTQTTLKTGVFVCPVAGKWYRVLSA